MVIENREELNIADEAVLLVLYRLLARIDETDEQALVLADVAVGIMTGVMKPVARVLTSLPVGPEVPGVAAGPPFELFYPPDCLLLHHRSAGFLYAERLRAAGRLAGGGSPPGPRRGGAGGLPVGHGGPW